MVNVKPNSDFDYKVPESKIPKENVNTNIEVEKINIVEIAKENKKIEPRHSIQIPPDYSNESESSESDEGEKLQQYAIKKISQKQASNSSTSSEDVQGDVGSELLVKSSTSSAQVYLTKKDLLPLISNISVAGQIGKNYILDKFLAQVEQSHSMSPEQKNSLTNLANAQHEKGIEKLVITYQNKLETPQWSKDLSSSLRPDKSKEQELKSNIKLFQTEVQKHLEEKCDLLLELLEQPEIGLSLKAQEELLECLLELKSLARDIEGSGRFADIHQMSEWDPDIGMGGKIHFELNSLNNDPIITDAASSIKAAGPSYSSQAPRNRSLDLPDKEIVPPNHFKTSYEINGNVVMAATRSAITVEFDQKDPQIRKQMNCKQVKKVLDVHVGSQLQKSSWDELQKATDPDHPISIKSMTVNLLTPDRIRQFTRENPLVANLASHLHEGLSGAPSDDERSLAEENLAAHQHWNERIVPYKIKNESGNEATVYVQFDLRYFNIPNNVMQEKTPEFLTVSDDIQKSNNENFEKLAQDTLKQSGMLKVLIKGAVGKLDNQERTQLKNLQQLSNQKQELRYQITNESNTKFEEWQKKADDLVRMQKNLEGDLSSTPGLKEALKLFNAQEQLADLFYDTQELYKGGFSRDLKNMDNNRSALATRLIALGSLLEDIEVHFGCRSGKDRTGLVDIEVKVFFTLAALTGRMLSYREEEKNPLTHQVREKVTLDSGNIKGVVTAVMGASVGLNTGGSASKSREGISAEAEKQHNELLDAAKGFAGVASRPTTNLYIPSGHLDKFSDEIVVSQNPERSALVEMIAAQETVTKQKAIPEEVTAAVEGVLLFTIKHNISCHEFNKIADTLKTNIDWQYIINSQMKRLSSKGISALIKTEAVDLRGYDRQVLYVLYAALKTKIESEGYNPAFPKPSLNEMKHLEELIAFFKTKEIYVNEQIGMKPLEIGADNRGYEIRFEDQETGVRRSGIFTPEAPELSYLELKREENFGTAFASGIPSGNNAHMSSRIIASSIVDKWLNSDAESTIPKIEFVYVNGKRGIFMEKPSGNNPSVEEEIKEEITDSVLIAQMKKRNTELRKKIELNKETVSDEQQWKLLAASFNYRNLEYINGTLIGTKAKFKHFDLGNSRTMAGLINRQISDIIVGECNDHPQNIVIDAGGKVSGKPSCCFGGNAIPKGDVRRQSSLMGVIPNQGSLMLRMPPVITQEMKDKISVRYLNSKELEKLKKELSPYISEAEIAATLGRLGQLYMHTQDSKKCRVVQGSDDLLLPENQKLMDPENSLYKMIELRYSNNEKDKNYLRSPWP